MLAPIFFSFFMLAPFLSFPTEAVALQIQASGKNGNDAKNGIEHRAVAPGKGNPGLHGVNAGSASKGRDAGMIAVHLSLNPEKNSVEINGETQLAVDLKSKPLPPSLVKIGSNEEINLIARGGKGGNGGEGGEGQAGAPGYSGQDATQDSGATDGSKGARGGDGGLGSSGASGGKGGTILIGLDEKNTHLLMLTQIDVSGGYGGEIGHHGVAGRGGLGGPGGAGCKWEKQEYKLTQVSDGQGGVQPTLRWVPVSHSRPGGNLGNRGDWGSCPTTELKKGTPGPNGSVQICVKENQSDRFYSSRYEVAVLSFSVVDESENGVFEPGERVKVTRIKLKNTGGMPTPRFQKVRIKLGTTDWMIPEEQVIEIPHSLASGEEIVLDEQLFFNIPDHEIKEARDRFRVDEKVSLIPGIEEVKRDFNQGVGRSPIQLTYPLEITPISNLQSLAPGDVAEMRFAIHNLAKKNLGELSDSQRKIDIRLSPSEDLAQSIVFFDETGQEIQSGDLKVDHINALSSQELKVIVGLRPDAPSYKKASFDFALDFDAPANKPQRTIQHRESAFQVSQAYEKKEGAEILLVSHSQTTDAELAAWRYVVHGLGLELSILNLSQMGRFRFSEIKEGFSGKTVIFLDQLLDTPIGNRYPHDYLNKRDFFTFIFKNRLKLLFLSDPDTHAMRQKFFQWFLNPIFSNPNRNTEEALHPWKSVDAFIKNLEPKQNNAIELSELSADYLLDETILIEDTYRIKNPSEDHLVQKAKELQETLNQKFPNRRFIVSYQYQAERIEKSCQYRLGTLHVAESLKKGSVHTLFSSVSNSEVHQPDYIRSERHISTLIFSLSFETKLKLFKRYLSGAFYTLNMADTTQNEPLFQEGVTFGQKLVDAILSELAYEQDAIGKRGSNYGLSEDQLKSQLVFLSSLVNLLSEELIIGSEDAKRTLIDLLSKIKIMSTAKVHFLDRVGNVFSKRRTIALHEATRDLYRQMIYAIAVADLQNQQEREEKLGCEMKPMEIDFKVGEFRSLMEVRMRELQESDEKKGTLEDLTLIPNLETKLKLETDFKVSTDIILNPSKMAEYRSREVIASQDCQALYDHTNAEQMAYRKNWSCPPAQDLLPSAPPSYESLLPSAPGGISQEN